MSLLDILTQAAQAANKGNTDKFDDVARQAPPDVLGQGFADAFRDKSTPRYEQMVGQMFGQSNANQQAGLLNQLLKAAGPAILASIAGGALAKSLKPGANQVSPEQASQLSPTEVEQITAQARSADPSLADQLGRFYAEHPTLVKAAGGIALTVALNKMTELIQQRQG